MPYSLFSIDFSVTSKHFHWLEDCIIYTAITQQQIVWWKRVLKSLLKVGMASVNAVCQEPSLASHSDNIGLRKVSWQVSMHHAVHISKLFNWRWLFQTVNLEYHPFGKCFHSCLLHTSTTINCFHLRKCGVQEETVLTQVETLLQSIWKMFISHCS